jgi:2-C-methyl-D-erythritol 2,4-cyclodiphosphate synthase
MIPPISKILIPIFVLAFVLPTVCMAFATSGPTSHLGVRTSRSSFRQTPTRQASTASTNTSKEKPSTSTDDLLQPTYEVEKIPLRIGHGFDIHRMVPYDVAGQPIMIGGVEITHTPQKWTDVTGEYCGTPNGIYETNLGVMAHSDGDVIYHSIVDAIFGALTLPDIGQVFQDTDPRWRGCDSSKFMEHATAIMKQYGYKIGNVDVTLILERPKVASFKPAMKENIVRLLETTPGRVNIKARTHERVDSVGELRSLSCHVVLTLELDNH